MKISEVIKKLQEAMNNYGDLKMFTEYGSVEGVSVVACRDGVSFENGKPVEIPDELELNIECSL